MASKACSAAGTNLSCDIIPPMSGRNGESVVSLEEAEGFVTTVALKAGEILTGYFKRRDFTSKQKKGVDFTTDADIEADKILRDEIAKKYPDHQFLTE